MALKIIIIFGGFVEDSTQQFDTMRFYQKILWGWKKVIFFILSEVQYWPQKKIFVA